ncbi:hypothetical protein [Falsiroseomonas sp. HW251]|uniref:hypothetical protein n=1 Tax=Falsiroseomonas sp. HW251 TaxID=3390998 RepID=UPI003D323CB6
MLAALTAAVSGTLISLLAACFLLEFMLLLRFQRKAKAAGRDSGSQSAVLAASRARAQEEREAKRA